MANVEIDGVNSKVYTDQVDPKTGTTLTLGTSGDTVSIPSGVTITNSGTDGGGFGINQTSFLPTAAPLIINGNMAISQRATSVTGNTTGGYTTVDRMQMQIGSLGTWTLIQEAQTSGAAFEAGFSNAFRIDCTTADASPAAADYLLFNYVLEGQDVQMFKKGTSAAETYTLAFWVKSNKTGTAQVNLRDDNSRMCSATYTISAGDTWEHKVLNFAADTTGTIDDDNSAGMQLHFWLDAGSDYTGGTAPTAWEAKVATDESANDLALGDSTSNDWAITGIQLEVGTYTSADLPPFRHESYGDNLRRCQRYLYKHLNGSDDYETVGIGCYRRTDMGEVFIYPPVTMRTDPTLSTVSGTNYFEFDWDGAPDYSNDLTLIRSSPNAQCLYSTSFSGTLGLSVECMTTAAAARVNFDAEL
jgi:hypothetical protein